MTTNWIKVARTLRDQAALHRDTAEKLRSGPRSKDHDMKSVEHGSASLTLLSLAIAIERGTD